MQHAARFLRGEPMPGLSLVRRVSRWHRDAYLSAEAFATEEPLLLVGILLAVGASLFVCCNLLLPCRRAARAERRQLQQNPYAVDGVAGVAARARAGGRDEYTGRPKQA